MGWIKNIFEISHTTHKTILSMEGIRGFAVFLVFLVHYVTLVETWIYGLLIRKEKPFVSYFLRRVQRIYPTFTVVFIIYIVLSAIFPEKSKIPDGFDGVIFLTQNFILMPGLFDVTAMITVAWSLSYEFFYYLLIPFVITVFYMRSWSPSNRIVFFLLISIIAFWYFASYGGHIRLLMFLSGILLFETTESKLIRKMPPIGLPALIVALVAVIVFNKFNANEWLEYVFLYCLFFIFCLDCFTSSGNISRLFSISQIRWLGNMSYSYYLIHGLALKFVFLVFEKIYPAQHTDTWIFWLLLPLTFFFTLIPSAILFVFVEKPFSLVRKNKDNKR